MPPRRPHWAQAMGESPGPGQGSGRDEATRQIEAELLAQVAAGQYRGSKTKTVAELIERWPPKTLRPH